MTNQEWIDDVLGRPYVDRAQGPDSFDCWGLVLDYCRRVLNVEPPTLPSYEAGQPFDQCYTQFRRQPEWRAKTLGFVFMGINDEPEHAGVVIDDYLVHANGKHDQCGGSVCMHPLRRIARLYKFSEFYEYVGNDSSN